MRTFCIALVLLSSFASQVTNAEEQTLQILATYNGSEFVAGYISYDAATSLGSPFGQEYFPLTGVSFTLPATGNTWTLAQAWHQNGPPG
jgi:hypothetical protein